MDKNESKSIVLTSLFWKVMERGGTQGVQFVVQIILARLLLPEEYGLIALVTIFISIANVFVQSGFNTALIQKKHVDSVDLSSVFYVSMMVSIVLYIILYIFAPNISLYYNNNQLTAIIRVLSITLFFGSLSSIQNAIIARELKFKKLFFSSLIAMVLSGIIGVYLAYIGFGIWALVIQQLCNQISITIILWISVSWRPQLLFSLDKVKELFSFGSKILISSLIDTMYSNVRSLLVGKIYTPSTLGYFNRGQQFPALIVTNVNGSIQSVMLPTLSIEQDNKLRVKSIVRRSIITSSFILFPMMIGLAVIAKPLVLIILTEKWLPAVPFLQIYCLSYVFWPIHTANLQAINAIGRSDIFLHLEIIKKILGIIVLLVTLKYGVYFIAIGEVLTSLISTFINSFPNKKLLSYSFYEQFIDIVPSIILSTMMGIAIYYISYFNMNNIATIVTQIVVGILVYISLAIAFRLESYKYIISTIIEFRTKQ